VIDAVRAVAALEEPQRARVYRVVRDAPAPITREDVAAAVGISRKLAAFHLDRLVAVGLLEGSFERPAGVTARIGRAPKRYLASAVEVEVSIPPRRYDLVAEVLLDAVERASPHDPAVAAAERAAHERGRTLGADTRTARQLGRLGPERALTVVRELFAELGFEPARHEHGIVQRNCPFQRLARHAPELVCRLNHHFVDGLLDGLQATRLQAQLNRADDRCCIVVSPI